MVLKAKRIWVLLTTTALVSSVGAGTVWSYLRTAHPVVGQSLRDAVPIEFELKRLEQMTQDLIPEIRANQKVAAQLDVEVEFLNRDVQTMRQTQDEAKAQMGKLRQALDDVRDTYDFGGKTFTRQQVEQDLARRLDHYESQVMQLTAKEQLLKARQGTLAAVTDKIGQYQQQRNLLVQKVEALQAELKLVELAQEAGNHPFDHSKLAEAKELAQQVDKRIRTLQKLVENDRQPTGEIPVEADSRPIKQRYDDLMKDK